MAGSELRRRTGFVALSLSAVLIASLVAVVPPIFIPEASAAAAQAPAPQPQPAIPPGDRLPVPAYPEENTVLDPAEALPVGLPDDVPPGQVPEGLTPLPARGGPNFDVFGVGPKARPHVATVFPSVVNFKASNGRWEHLPTQFVPDPSGGWRAEPLGASLRFPQQLSVDDPVQITFPGGMVRIAPTGAGGAGTSDGPTITYADALAATDFVYGLQGGGYKEDVVLKDPSASGIISYQLKAPGFDLAATSGGGSSSPALAAWSPPCRFLSPSTRRRRSRARSRRSTSRTSAAETGGSPSRSTRPSWPLPPIRSRSIRPSRPSST